MVRNATTRGTQAVDRSHASTRGRPHGRQNFKPPFMLFCKLPSSHRGIRSLSSTILPAERVRKVPEMNRQALARTSLPLQAHSLVRARARSRRGRRPGTAHGTSSASAVCPSRARKSHRGEPAQAPLWNVHVQQGRQSAHGGVYAWQSQKSFTPRRAGSFLGTPPFFVRRPLEIELTHFHRWRRSTMNNAPADPLSWYYDIPVVTRVYLTAAFITTVSTLSSARVFSLVMALSFLLPAAFLSAGIH